MRKVLLVLFILYCLSVDAAIFSFSQRQHLPNSHPDPLVNSSLPFSPIPAPTEPPQPVLPDFVKVDVVRQRVNEKSLYADIMNHSRNPVTGYDRSTNAHETTHMINNDIRNAQSGSRVNAFYVLEGRGVVLEEPKIQKSAVKEFLPQSLRSFRYKTYITGQREWENQPLYLMDEAVSYWNDARVSIEDVKNGRMKKEGDISGLVDFSIYSIALAMAVEKYDPEYWKNNDLYRKFLIWYLKSCEENYNIGSKMKEFNWFRDPGKLLDALRNSAETAPVRAFIQKNLQGVWLGDKK